MNQRRLGSTDFKIAPLVLGGNVFGWTADRAASFAVLDAFVEAGGTMIDTADIYANWADGLHGGESETVIGEWLRTSGKRDRVLIASKVGYAPDKGGELDPSHIAAACDASLRRLGIDAIDLYYAHQDDRKVPQEAVLEALGKLVDAGKVRVLGASNFSAARLKSAVDLSRDGTLPRYHVFQPAYNLVDRKGFEGELQAFCVAENIAALPYRGLAAGFLTGKYRSADDLAKSVRGKDAKAPLEGNGPAVLAAMDEIAAETGAPLAAIALAWLREQPGVCAPIASARAVDQLPDLLASLTLDLDEDQLARLTNAGA